ncbi:MAG TPA: hypothetical protein VM370_09040 [Candidatus Thermoplasmatota archaeon]|nr:hypothetical protein [Candidatus Thermoplasmatota archaeon]
MSLRTLSVFLAALLVAAGPLASATGPPTQTARYLSGTVQAEAPAGGNNAWGFVDCSGSVPLGEGEGGSCFRIPPIPPGSEVRVTVVDDITGSDVGIFAGFDRDGDGCVGCTSPDDAWQGTGSLASITSGGAILLVFIRTAAVDAADVGAAHATAGTMGTITVSFFFPGETPCSGERGPIEPHPECGERFRGGPLPYPYQTL